MRKQLGVLSSFALICATALFWVGCSGWGGGYGNRSNDACCDDQYNEQYYDSQSFEGQAYDGQPFFGQGQSLNVNIPGYAEPISANECAPCTSPCGDTKTVSSGITCDGVKVTASQQSMCLQGEQYTLDLCIEAFKDVCDVTLSTMLPEGVVFVKSDPEAHVDGERLVWHLPHMDRGDARHVRIWLRCEREGEICACFCVSATPVAFCTLLCAKPVLCCHKCGPEEACPGDCLSYTISVTNKGSCVAKDVLVTDLIPEGLEHVSGQNTLSFKLGDLAPCQTKTLNLSLKACARGKLTNRIVVTSCNADEVGCEWTTCVCKYCCNIIKEGPKEVKVGQNADYKITFTNDGDKPLTDVTIVDDAPCGTAIVSANGAAINGNRAIWTIDTVEPGKVVEVPITLTTCTPGYYCNRVNSTNCQGICCSAEACTRWRGTPALNVCIVDLEDPICVGDTTSYRISVVNQGSEVDHNVRVTVDFPDELVPLSARGASAGDVSGQSVTFAPLQTLNARQTVEYRLDARAKSRGDARIKVKVMSDSITTPIVQEESTIVN